MTEEEKKALDLLKEYSEDELFGIAGREALQIILNLIEKQQEEIKELKLITNTYNSYEGKDMDHTKIIIADSNYFINGTFVKKFVSKDKIREYYYKICASVNHFKSKNDNNIVKRTKKYLEQLLEE